MAHLLAKVWGGLQKRIPGLPAAVVIPRSGLFCIREETYKHTM